MSTCSVTQNLHHARVISKRRKWWLILLAGAAVVFIIATFNGEREPSYDGHALSHWLDIYNRNDPESPKAHDAIAHIGTNGLPFLLKWMKQKPSGWRIYLLNLRDNEFSHRWKWLPNWATGYGTMRRGDVAIVAFANLGPAAAPAIPQLTALARSPDGNLSTRGSIALSLIGPPAIPALVQILEDQNAPAEARFKATRNLNELVYPAMADGTLGTNAMIAVLPLARNLGDKDEYVAGEAAAVLGTLGLQPEICVPALTNALQDTRSIVRDQAATALGRFGSASVPAVPKLLQAVREDSEIRESVIIALMRIQPDALKTVEASLVAALTDADNSVQVAATNALKIVAPHVLTNAILQ